MALTNNKHVLTPEGFKKLKEELEQLKQLSRVTIASKIKDARELGNVLENNVVYDAAVEELGVIEGKIQELEEVLGVAEIIDKSEVENGLVVIGSIVTVVFEDKEDTFTVVGSAEADPLNRLISNESPVGSALLGARVGDTIEIKTPVFKAVYKIVTVK